MGFTRDSRRLSCRRGRMAWVESLIREDDADGDLALFGAAIDADHVAAQLHVLHAVDAGSFHAYLQLGLQARSVAQRNERALEVQIVDHGVLLESVAAFGDTANVSAELRFATQGGAAAGHVRFDALAGRAEGDDHAFAGGEDGVKFLAGVAQNGVHDAVGGIRIVVEEDEGLGANFLGHADTVEPTGMAPTAAGAGELLRRVLSVVDENVGASGELAKALIELGVARLIIGGIDDRAGGRVDAKAQAALRVVEPAGSDFVFADLEGVAAGDFLELALGGHGGHIHGEIGDGHLRFEDLLETVAAEKF